MNNMSKKSISIKNSCSWTGSKKSSSTYSYSYITTYKKSQVHDYK